MKTVQVSTYQKYPDLEVAEGTMRHLSSDTVLRYNGRRFGLVLTPAGAMINRGPGRKRSKLERAEAATYGLAVCIDNFGGTGAEAARNTAAGTEHVVEDGDTVVFDTGDVFTVGPLTEGGWVRREYLALALADSGHCVRCG